MPSWSPMQKAIQFAILLYLVTHGVHPPAGDALSIRELAQSVQLALLAWMAPVISLLGRVPRLLA
jgi:hypothetical protein